ncbi:hypothetical protein G168_gp48 [Lactobacillus phage ATCC8014]|uniref:Nif11 domain-containing protein n=1 Tax=Lactobacillus phage ATCC8014 TaxID=2892340 RepID=K4I496_9CAUD|nr:hypothetical protein G168_gp48 [Lactobacillus phage ATCC8014]AFU63055.1 hypothetical protein 8014-B1_0048 [Lactobacillus phage ATCC8014]
MMKREEFLKRFNIETDFTNHVEILENEARRKELREMCAIYNRTTTDAEFTEAMHRAGYEVIE